MQKGREAEALSVFRKLTEEDPRFMEAWNNRAALEAAKGDLEAAQTSLEKAIAAHSDVSVINRNLEKVRSRLARMAYDSAFGTQSNLPPLLLDVQREPMPLAVDSSALRQRDSLSRELNRIREASRRDLSRKDSVLAGREVEIRRLRSELERATAAMIASSQVAAAPTVVAQASPAPQPQTRTPDPAHAVEKPVAATTPQVVVARTEPAPAKSKPLPKAPETSAAVLAAMHGWAQAWSSKNVDQYLSYYSDRFVPLGKPDRKSWEDYRRERISAPKSIRVEILSPKIRMLKDHHAEVVYRQVYQTEEARLTSRKRLELAWEQGVWRIFAEKEAR